MENFLVQAAEHLRSRRVELLAELNAEVDELRNQSTDGNAWDDPNEGFDAVTDYVASGLAEHVADEIHKVDEALTRIRTNTYGRCTCCSRTISKQRLKAVPTATMCVRCTTAAEQAAQTQASYSTEKKRRKKMRVS